MLGLMMSMPILVSAFSASQTKTFNASQTRVSFCDDSSAPTQFVWTVDDLDPVFGSASSFSGCVVWHPGNYNIKKTLYVHKDMEIKGDSGNYPVIRPADTSEHFPLFQVDGGVNVKMSWLNLGSGSSSDGGCILMDEEYESASDLELHSIYMSDCVATEGNGGAIYVRNGNVHGDDIHYARCSPDDCYADTSKGPASCPS